MYVCIDRHTMYKDVLCTTIIAQRKGEGVELYRSEILYTTKIKFI